MKRVLENKVDIPYCLMSFSTIPSHHLCFV